MIPDWAYFSLLATANSISAPDHDQRLVDSNAPPPEGNRDSPAGTPPADRGGILILPL